MNNYASTTNPLAREKVEATLLEELQAGNYVVTSSKPRIVSALGAVPKPDSEDLRLIHDCSMPPGKGVNSYIDIEKQTFQTIDSAVKMIEPGCYMAKIDLRHAYRSVPVHPANHTALGLKWKFSGDSTFTYLMDTRLPFGGRSAPGIFHRLTQAIRRMMIRRGYGHLVVYLDDFLIIGRTFDECQKAYDTLMNLLIQLGFEISLNKLVTPCQKLTFLGVEINSVAMTLSLPESKLDDLRSSIDEFRTRKRATKRQLQRLAGKLNWACKVVYGGRTFLRRLLDLMNSMPKSGSKSRLSYSFHQDISWWAQFLETFNGQCDFYDTRPITDLQTDACQHAIGGAFQGDWFYSNLLVDHPDLAGIHINYKETLAVVFSIERWAPKLRNKTVHVHCDNTTAVAILNKGTSCNDVTMHRIRRLFWLSAKFNFRIKAFYVPGVDNTLADNISRLHQRQHFLSFMEYLDQATGGNSLHVPSLEHMSPHSFWFLLGLYSSASCLF